MWKVFGKRAGEAREMAEAGAGREEIRTVVGSVVAVRDVSFQVSPGETFVVMGLSGSGKSTLVRCVSHLIEPTDGTVEVCGTELTRADSATLRDLRRRWRWCSSTSGCSPIARWWTTWPPGWRCRGWTAASGRIAPESSWRLSALRAGAIITPSSSAAACSNGWDWPGRWPWIPRCCSSTVIFALAPVVRLTEVGLRTVPQSTVEASEMFGATERQTLRWVRLPQARPAILAGMNQTTMLAMSMVVIAAFIGAGGLGQVVLQAMQSINVGKASEAGIAIVIMAIILDRFSTGIATADPGHDARPMRWLAVVTAVGAVVGGFLGYNDFPEALGWRFAPYVNSMAEWARDNLYDNRWFGHRDGAVQRLRDPRVRDAVARTALGRHPVAGRDRDRGGSRTLGSGAPPGHRDRRGAGCHRFPWACGSCPWTPWPRPSWVWRPPWR